MAAKKKNFAGGIEGLINPIPAQQVESPVPEKTTLVRNNFVMKSEYHMNLKLIATKEHRDIKDALAEALDDFFIKKADLL